MAEVNVVNHLIFPSERDINAGIAGQGRAFLEAHSTQFFQGLNQQRNCVIGGFWPVATGAGLTKAVPSGAAIIDGRFIRGDLSNNVPFTANTTNYLFLRVIYLVDPVDGLLKASALQLETNTTGTRPANAVRIGRVVTDGSGVTSVADERVQGKVCYGSIGSGANIVNRGTDDWSVTSLGSEGTTARRRITFAPGFLANPIFHITQYFGGDPSYAPDHEYITLGSVVDVRLYVDSAGSPSQSALGSFSFVAYL